jgi:hypothetical protein
MNNRIPFPKIVRKNSATDPGQEVTQGELAEAIHSIWRKFNDSTNLSKFRHNIRPYYDETSPLTEEERNQIRAYLSDQGLRIYVTNPGDQFRWDKRTTNPERKIIYLSQRWHDRFDMINALTDGQKNTLRLAFMVVLLHNLGDYITLWARRINLSPDQQEIRYEGGTETEYAFFGGIIDGVSLDANNNFRLDYARFCTFDESDRSTHWTIPDNVARDIYANAIIEKPNMATLTRWAGFANESTSQQLEICCGFHRVSWRPHRRRRPQPPPPPQIEPPVPNFPGVMQYIEPQIHPGVAPPQTNFHPSMFQAVPVHPQVPYSPPPSTHYSQTPMAPPPATSHNFRMYGNGVNVPNAHSAGSANVPIPPPGQSNWANSTGQYTTYPQTPVTQGKSLCEMSEYRISI